MYYSYDGLERFLSVKGMTKTSLATELGISSKTMAKMSRGEKIADHVLKGLPIIFPVPFRSFAPKKPTICFCKLCGTKRMRRSPADCITSCKCA